MAHSDPDTHVLEPVQEPFSTEIAGLLAQYPHRNGYLLKLFRVFANSARFLRKGTVNLLDRESPLTMRQREIVILRVCARNDCEYEWGVHVAAFAHHVGLTPAQVVATRLEPQPEELWTCAEGLLITAVDELCDSGRLRPHTRQRFQTHFTVEQQLEILALCGNYHTISFVANVAQLDAEDFAARAGGSHHPVAMPEEREQVLAPTPAR